MSLRFQAACLSPIGVAGVRSGTGTAFTCEPMGRTLHLGLIISVINETPSGGDLAALRESAQAVQDMRLLRSVGVLIPPHTGFPLLESPAPIISKESEDLPVPSGDITEFLKELEQQFAAALGDNSDASFVSVSLDDSGSMGSPPYLGGFGSVNIVRPAIEAAFPLADELSGIEVNTFRHHEYFDELRAGLDRFILFSETTVLP